MTSSTSSHNYRLQLDNTLRGTATALFIVAGFVVLDLIFILADLPLRLIFNLGIFQFTEDVWPLLARAVLGLSLAGVFGVLGWFARQGHVWAFGVAIALCIVDGGFTLARTDWVNLGFHLFLLIGLWSGLNTARQIKALPATSVQE